MIPTILTIETDVVRDDEFGEEHLLTVTVTGAVWADWDESTDGRGAVQVRLKTATDNENGRFISSVDELSWTERTWAEDSLAGAWEDLNEAKP